MPRLSGLLALTIVALLAQNVGSASALTQRPYLSQIAGFTQPTGLSGGPADDLWVTDPGNAGLISELSPFPAGAKIGEQDGEGHFTFGGDFIDSAAFSAANEHLYVGDSGEEVVHVFKPDGEWEATWTGFSGAGNVHVAVDNSPTASEGRVYVSEGNTSTVKAFKPGGEAEPFSAAAPYIEENKLTGTPTGPGETLEPFAGTWNMTVGTDGNLYLVESGGAKVDEFEPSGTFVRQFTGAGSPFRAVAVDPTSGNVLAAAETAILEFSPIGALEGETTKANGASFTRIEGLAVDSVGNLYVADRSAGHVDVFGAAEPLPVETDGGSVTAVTDTTALLQAQVSPNGQHTSYAFLYGTADCLLEPGACTEAPSPMAPLGNGEATLQVTRSLGNLAPATTYHYRLLVEDTDNHETLSTPDRTFTTQGPAASLLPDDRAWELVSPPDKHGAALEAIANEGGLIQAAAGGGGIAYIANGAAVAEPAGNRSNQKSPLLSTRSPEGGWQSQDISTPHQAPVGVSARPGEYLSFSPDLSLAALQPEGATPLTPETTEKTPYLRLPGGGYEPLVTAANVPAGVQFGCEQGGVGGVDFVTATPDLSHLVLISPDTLTSGFSPAYQPTCASPESIFEWSAGSLQLVSQVPPGTAHACGPTGPACQIAAEVGNLSNVGYSSYQVRGAVSGDGSRVLFETLEGTAESRRLYLRDTAPGREQTLQIDAAEPACLAALKCRSGGGTFQYASADGSRVFFTDAQRLTIDSTAGPVAGEPTPDLYMCQVEETPGGLACDLTDLTANHLHPSEPAAVQSTVIGAAEDGSDVYFVAEGALTASPGPEGETAQSGQPNLYRWSRAGGIEFVAVLSSLDRADWTAFQQTNLGTMTSRVSPDGRYLAFMSQRPLTGYDNRDARSGVRDQEVFLYDSQGSPGHQLVCASCDPSGARPQGLLDPGGFPGLLVDRPHLWGGQTLAAAVPGWTKIDLVHALYQSRYLSNSGRLFFNAADSLVPQDTNGTFDVYQFEFPQGPGQPASDTCTTTSSTYSPAPGGCVSLISSGTSSEESAFMDASESGDDVFFLTASRLTTRDVDTSLDLYDARVGGGEPTEVKPVECSGDACQQSAVPPNDATPGSLTFNGAGNLLQCPKGKVKQKGKCVKKKQSKKNKGKKHKKNGKHKKSKRKSGNQGKKQKRADSKRGGHK